MVLLARRGVTSAQLATALATVSPLAYDWKESVRAATTANITLSAPQTIDGVAVIAGNRVLVKDQTAGTENGLYVVAAGAWARSADADVSSDVTAGLAAFVSEGTVNGNKAFALITDDPITLNVTALVFTQIGGSGSTSPADALPGAETFGAAGTIGVGTDYAREDHAHPMMADPVTAHAAAADPHTGYALESALALDALTDVVITSPAIGQGLRHNGTSFRNLADRVFDVRDYGAIADGVTDASAAINAAIQAAKIAGTSPSGAAVYIPGDFALSVPLVLPRTTDDALNTVHLIGDGARLSRLQPTSSFPAYRALVEWEETAAIAWNQRIQGIGFRIGAINHIPLNVRAIHYKLTDKSTADAMIAERMQLHLEDILIDVDIRGVDTLIWLEGCVWWSWFEEVYARITGGGAGSKEYGALREPLLFKGDHQFNGTDPVYAGDTPSFFQTTFKNVGGALSGDRPCRLFEGRLLHATFGQGFSNGALYGPVAWFRNSAFSKVEGIANEGRGDNLGQVRITNSRMLTGLNLTVAVPDTYFRAWEAATDYTVGTASERQSAVKPTDVSSGKNRWYRCEVTGTSHATTEPTWPAAATTVDNTATHTDLGPAERYFGFEGWRAGAVYQVGMVALPLAFLTARRGWVCTVAGTTGASAPVMPAPTTRTDGTATWQAHGPAEQFWAAHSAPQADVWTANTAYKLGQVVLPTLFTTAGQQAWICTVAGTSHATTEPTWPAAQTVTDGGATWRDNGPLSLHGGSETWRASTAYVKGVTVLDPVTSNTSRAQICTTAGTAGTVEPTWASPPANFTDNTTTWSDQGYASGFGLNVENCADTEIEGNLGIKGETGFSYYGAYSLRLDRLNRRTFVRRWGVIAQDLADPGLEILIEAPQSHGNAVELIVQNDNADAASPLGSGLPVYYGAERLGTIAPDKLLLSEITAPDNAPANGAYLFVEDTGGGKTRLCIRYASGATRVLDTEA